MERDHAGAKTAEVFSSTGVHESWWHEQQKRDEGWWRTLPKERAPRPDYEARTCTCGSSLWRKASTTNTATED